MCALDLDQVFRRQEQDLSTRATLPLLLLHNCCIQLEDELEACDGCLEGCKDGIHLLVDLDMNIHSSILVPCAVAGSSWSEWHCVLLWFVVGLSRGSCLLYPEFCPK